MRNQNHTIKSEDERITVRKENGQIAVYHEQLPDCRMVWQDGLALIEGERSNVAIMADADISFIRQATSKL
jgi:hypothetical protein